MLALEEQFRESACYGDVDALSSLLKAGVNVNSPNTMNGWTALHWACKRGHEKCKDLLLSWGADIEIMNSNGQTPLNLEASSPLHHNEKEGFVPNYMQHPELHQKVKIKDSIGFNQQPENENATHNVSTTTQDDKNVTLNQYIYKSNNGDTAYRPNGEQYEKDGVRIIKARLMKSDNYNVPSTNQGVDVSPKKKKIALSKAVHLLQNDFIEVDIPVRDMSMSGLIQVVLEDLQIEYPTNIGTHNVYVRKLPNTRLRKDVEIARLKDYEEIEIGLLDHLENGHSS